MTLNVTDAESRYVHQLEDQLGCRSCTSIQPRKGSDEEESASLMSSKKRGLDLLTVFAAKPLHGMNKGEVEIRRPPQPWVLGSDVRPHADLPVVVVFLLHRATARAHSVSWIVFFVGRGILSRGTTPRGLGGTTRHQSPL